MNASSCYFVVVVLVLVGSSDSVHVPFGFPGLRVVPVFCYGSREVSQKTTIRVQSAFIILRVKIPACLDSISDTKAKR